ncbi:MAG: 2Fe-2S iron-sulfur cluster-binding protein, partial [Deltaproteobacteria bacterium]|nr:2Fe-2S iron-sulfur cluster-binding protein [Deltaproteobacteria bacterium]
MERKTVNITIDGRLLEVEKGNTILQAGREFGIHIPTMCY